MAIIFVSGPPCSGKSTFIEENFKNRKIIDLYDFQKDLLHITYETIWKSYVDCMEAIKTAIQNNEEIVVEHTLLKEIRRKYYIDEIRKITNEEIIIYFIIPTKEEYKNRVQQRKIRYSDETIEMYLETSEIPNESEGFFKVIIVK